MSDRPLHEKLKVVIRSGRVDEHLEEIWEVLQQRTTYVHRLKAIENFNALDVGDEVAVKLKVRPKYLAGQPGVIESVDSGRSRGGVPLFSVKLRCGPIGKFRSGRVLFSPGSLDLIRKRANA